MAIDEHYIELINADIDGEIQPDDKASLDAFLAGNAEARAMHEGLARLCETLDSEEMLGSPPHMRHVIMNTIAKGPEQSSRAGFLKALFAAPALRYAATFAAGAIIAMTLLESSKISNSAFRDVTGLVGTMSEPSDYGPGVASVAIDHADVAGTITLRNADPILIVDFDLSTDGPIDIIASYNDKSIWFNGFAQLESTGTSISAGSGQVRIQIEGKRRYAVYLHNSGSRSLAIDLEFFANGEAIHRASLEYQ